jgi:hypothetical protein
LPGAGLLAIISVFVAVLALFFLPSIPSLQQPLFLRLRSRKY